MVYERSDVDEYLHATPMCDYNDPSVRECAGRVVANAQTEREKAALVFKFVRDTIRFSMAFSGSKASRILKVGYGDCATKTNVQVALLRAVGIPARLHWAMVRSNVLRGLVADFVLRSMPPEASHFWGECSIQGRWISCEALLDKPLYEGMLKQGLITDNQMPTIDWDSENDLVLLKPWITGDRGTVESADEAIRAVRSNGEGMPSVWIERLIAPLFFPYNLRFSDRIRHSAEV